FMFYIDLDELELLQKKLFFFSRNAFNLFSFKDKEHLQFPAGKPDTTRSTKEQISGYLKEQGVEIGKGKILLLTNLNVLGYNFNPVSFYYCFDESGQPLCCVVEITNTFKEQKPFFIGSKGLENERFRLHTTKYFYVSPFIDHDTDFDFNLAVPGENLSIKIDDYKKGKRFFISTLTGEKKTLDNLNMIWYAIRFPLIPLQIITLIHWHALKLWLKKLPYHKKAAFPELQQNVFNKYTG
ncbi:MAG: DUF1365 domain-containing protein, partial [Bacteroidota bacterium]